MVQLASRIVASFVLGMVLLSSNAMAFESSESPFAARAPRDSAKPSENIALPGYNKVDPQVFAVSSI